jgi:hypothetical protein
MGAGYDPDETFLRVSYVRRNSFSLPFLPGDEIAARDSGGYLSPTDISPTQARLGVNPPANARAAWHRYGPGHEEQRGHNMYLRAERAALRDDATRLLDELGATLHEVTRSLGCMGLEVRLSHPDDSPAARYLHAVIGGDNRVNR